MACKELIGWRDKFGYMHYKPCHHKVYCVANFKESTTGNMTSRELCKKHFNALVKNCARVEKLCNGWEANLTHELI